MAKPIHLKEEGNRRFQAGDYVMAEALYSQAYGAPPFSLPSSLPTHTHKPDTCPLTRPPPPL
jgi:hypothetical protein